MNCDNLREQNKICDEQSIFSFDSIDSSSQPLESSHDDMNR